MRKWIVFLLIIIISIFPAMVQKQRVLIDTVHGNNEYATSQLTRVFAEEEVDTPPFSPLNPQMLRSYDVLVISSPRVSYLPQEVLSICSFVREGGTLIILSNGIISYNLSDILACFRAEINRDVVEGFGTVYARGIFSPEDLHFDNPSSLEIYGDWDFIVTTDQKGFSRRIERSREFSQDYLKEPGTEPVIAAGKKVDRGAIFIIGEIPNFSYSSMRTLIHDFSLWIPPKNYDERLHAYKKIFGFQKSLEKYYYKKIPLESSLFLEEAWIAYYDDDYQLVEEKLRLAEATLQEKKISFLWYAVPVILFFSCLVVMWFFKIGGKKEKIILILGIIMLATSSIFVAFHYNFSSFVVKALLLLAVFLLGIIRLEKKFTAQLGLFCIFLSIFYFSGFPASSTLGPYYSPERLIIPDSVPVALLASEINQLKEKGAIIDDISFVEDYVNARIKYRTEDQNYFPTPVVTTGHGEGNCFRQALYAASVLIRLGHKAHVVSGIDHAWVEIDGRGILYPKPPSYLRFDNEEIAVEYFPSGAFLMLVFIGLIIAYWPPPTIQSLKDTFFFLLLTFVFMYVLIESSYLPNHLLIVTFPLLFLLFRFASKKRHFKLTSKQQFYLKFGIITICFFVFVVFPLLATIGRLFTYYYIFFVFPLLITIFMAIFAELFTGSESIVKTLFSSGKEFRKLLRK